MPINIKKTQDISANTFIEQDALTIRGDFHQDIVPQGLNLWNENAKDAWAFGNGVQRATPQNDGSIRIWSNFSKNTQCGTQILLKPNTSYYISFYFVSGAITSGTSGTERAAVGIREWAGKSLSSQIHEEASVTWTNKENSRIGAVVKTSEKECFCYSAWIAPWVGSSADAEIYIKDVMVLEMTDGMTEEEAAAIPYEPFVGYPTPDNPIDVVGIGDGFGKNLLHFYGETYKEGNGVTWEWDPKHYCYIGNGLRTGGANVMICKSDHKFYLKPGIYYSIPTNFSGVSMTGAREVPSTSWNGPGTSTGREVTEEERYAQVYYEATQYQKTAMNNLKLYPMVSTDPKAIDEDNYVPYHKCKLVIEGKDKLGNAIKENVYIDSPLYGDIDKIRSADRATLSGNHLIINRHFKTFWVECLNSSQWTITDWPVNDEYVLLKCTAYDKLPQIKNGYNNFYSMACNRFNCQDDVITTSRAYALNDERITFTEASSNRLQILLKKERISNSINNLGKFFIENPTYITYEMHGDAETEVVELDNDWTDCYDITINGKSIEGKDCGFYGNSDIVAREFIENAATAYGRTTQKVTYSQNLLPDYNTQTVSISNGITFTKNDDGSYTISGKNNGNGNSVLYLVDRFVLKAGHYYFMTEQLELYKNVAIVFSYKQNGSTVYKNYAQSGSFSSIKDMELAAYIQIVKGNQTEFDNVTFYPMMADHPITEADWEPYSESFDIKNINLYNYKDTSVVTSNGVTVDDNGWITMSHASTVYLDYFTHDLDLKENTSYLCVFEVKDISGTGLIDVVDYVSTTGQFKIGMWFNFSDLKSGDVKFGIVKTREDFSILTQSVGLRTFAAFEGEASGSITFRISILEDTTITPDNFVYRPYGEKPTFDLPGELKSIGYVNSFDKYKLTDGYETTFKLNDENGFDIEGTYYVSYPFVADGGTVSLSYDYRTLSGMPTSFSGSWRIAYEGVDQTTSEYLKSGDVIKIEKKTRAIYFYCSTGNNVSGVFSNVILSDDSRLYIPTDKYGIEINEKSKNLFDSERWYREYRDVSISYMEKTVVDNIEYYNFNYNNARNYKFMEGEFKENTQYTLNFKGKNKDIGTPSNCGLYFYYADGKSTGVNITTDEETEYYFTSEAGKTIESIRINGHDGKRGLVRDIILYEGTEDKEYKPYVEELSSITLDQPLRSLPNGTKDLLYVKDKHLYIERKVGEYIATGTEDIIKQWQQDQSNHIYELKISLDNSKRFENATNNIICMSSHYIAIHYNGGEGSLWRRRKDNEYEDYLIAIRDEESSSYVGNVLIKDMSINTVDELRNFLKSENEKGTPVTILYELNNSITEDLSEINLEDFEIEGKSYQEKILPEEYTQVEYIIANNAPYIDTEYKTNSNTKIVIKGAGTADYLVSSGSGGHYTDYGILCGRKNGVSCYIGRIRIDETHNKDINSSVPIGDDLHTFELSMKNGFFIDGEFIGNTEPYDFTGQANLGICGFISEDGIMGGYSVSRVAWCKIYDNDILVRNFIACYRNEDNVLGLYDLVNDKFYTNAGKKDFTYDKIQNLPSPEFPSGIKSLGNINSEGKYEINLKPLVVLNEPLRSLPMGTQDELIIFNDYVAVKRNVGEFVFYGNSSEEWIALENDTHTLYSPALKNIIERWGTSIINQNIISPILYSNKYLVYHKQKYNASEVPNDKCIIIDNNYNLYVYDKNKEFDLNEWKQSLSSDNLIVYYPLNKSIITDIQKLPKPIDIENNDIIINADSTIKVKKYINGLYKDYNLAMNSFIEEEK